MIEKRNDSHDNTTPSWQEFNPSTFTYLGRNDIAYANALNCRRELGFEDPKLVYLIGSSVLEPFTIAALPGMEKTEIIAVDINAGVADLFERIKKGNTLSWIELADVAHNPGFSNSDFLDIDRLSQSFTVLEQLGSKTRLGNEFNLNTISIPKEISERVSFVHADANSFLRSASPADIIGDFFVQTNVNKQPRGPEYSAETVRLCLSLLQNQGVYIIGDTGKNLPVTFSHFLQDELSGVLNFSSMVHAVNFGQGFITSHYLLASKMEEIPGREKIMQKAIKRMKENQRLSQFQPIQSDDISLSQVSDDAKIFVNLAYIGSNNPFGTSFRSTQSQAEVLGKVLPTAKDEMSEAIIFDAQKPFQQVLD